jgi:hypothetical protein
MVEKARSATGLFVGFPEGITSASPALTLRERGAKVLFEICQPRIPAIFPGIPLMGRCGRFARPQLRPLQLNRSVEIFLPLPAVL